MQATPEQVAKAKSLITLIASRTKAALVKKGGAKKKKDKK
jgi:hypothetical protein